MLGWRGMAGLIVPANNSVVLPELTRMLPDGVTVYETRMSVSGDLTVEAVQQMVTHAKEASRLLGETGVDVIGYCCMGSSVIKGWDWEDGLLRDVSARARLGATSANRALVGALESFSARNIALITPYPAEINAMLPRFFAARGIQVKSVAAVEIRAMSEVRFIQPERFYGVARRMDLAGVDALCLLATDMQTVSVIGAIELDLGIPVLSNNQAIAWEIMRRLGLPDRVQGYGRLLSGHRRIDGGE